MAADKSDKKSAPDTPKLRSRWTYGNIRVIYEAETPFSQPATLPPYLAASPTVGDIVESIEGRRLEVKEIVHTMDGRSAALKLIVGRPSGGEKPAGDHGTASQDIIGITP